MPDPDPLAAVRDRCDDALEQPLNQGRPVKLVAVMTCDLGVLIRHGSGAHASSQFPTVDSVGAVESADVSESAAAALARGVQDQTGLSAVIHGEISRQVNPHTHTSTIYLACTPELGFGQAAAGTELYEVQWARWPEVEELVLDLPPLVRDFLVIRLGWQNAGAAG